MGGIGRATFTEVTTRSTVLVRKWKDIPIKVEQIWKLRKFEFLDFEFEIEVITSVEEANIDQEDITENG